MLKVVRSSARSEMGLGRKAHSPIITVEVAADDERDLSGVNQDSCQLGLELVEVCAHCSGTCPNGWKSEQTIG